MFKPKPKKRPQSGRPPNKHPGGRPTVMHEKTIEKLEQAYSLDCTDSEACIYAGIKPATLYKFQKDNPEFIERKQLLKGKPVLKARGVILNELNKENSDIAKWYLERKRKSEFSIRQENVANLHVQTKFSGLSEDELDNLINELKEDDEQS